MQSYDEFFEEQDRIVEMQGQFRKSHIETTEDIYKIVNVLARDMDLIMGNMVVMKHQLDNIEKKLAIPKTVV